MTEMVIPGTYVEVRAEGLISAGRISTGVVGIVGTAASGPVGKPITLSGFGDARDRFGAPDDAARPEDGANPLTLVRALEQLYNGGATTVIAVRVAGSSRSSASLAIEDVSGRAVATLTAKTPGTWGNDVHALVEAAEDDCKIDGEVSTAGFDRLRYAPVVPSPQNQIKVFRGITKRTDTLNVVYKPIVAGEPVTRDANNRFFLKSLPVEAVTPVNSVKVLDGNGGVVREYSAGAILYDAGAPPVTGQIRLLTATGEITFEANQVPSAGQKVVATYAAGHAAPKPGEALITTWDGSITFAPGEAPKQASGDKLTASYVVDRGSCARTTLRYGSATEVYTAPDGIVLAALVNRSSRIADAAVDAVNGGSRPKAPVDAYFGTGSNTAGNNGADAGANEYAAGLEQIENLIVNIVVLAGQDASTMGSVLLKHLGATEQTDHERIGVIGAKGSTVDDFLGHTMASDRVILVAPGLAFPDGSTLPAAYTAATVAGLISSLDVQTSLTNKPLNVPGLAVAANRGQQAQLIRANVLAIVAKEGYRVLKGITTAGEGAAFAAIPTRRIVDYAKYGVRSASNPYIGRLNNARVRAALKATLDAFLTRMVEDEALTAYELEVSATRAQEIAGEVSVVMTIQPTFSIDFIKVTMILK